MKFTQLDPLNQRQVYITDFAQVLSSRQGDIELWPPVPTL
jgi:hypothetical protein